MYAQFLGHSSVSLHGDYCSALIDPFFAGNPMACRTADDYISLDGLLLTRFVPERKVDVLAIIKETECPVICDATTARALQAEGVKGDQIVVMAPGESKDFGFGRVEMVPGAGCVTYLVEVEKHLVWYAGESAFCPQWSELADKPVDLAFVPIGGGAMMDPQQAAEAVKLVKPREACPMAYGTFPSLTSDANGFKNAVGSAGAVVLLQSSEKEHL